MSVYFFLVLQAYLGIILYLALWGKNISVKDFVLSSLIGVLSAFVVFKIASDYLVIDELKTISYSFSKLLLILFFVSFILRFRVFKIIVATCLIFCFSVYYRVLSYDFPLFSGELLDTLSIVSFGYTLLGFGTAIVLYLLLREASSKLSRKVRSTLIIITTLLLVSKLFADGMLELMRFGILDTSAGFLSLIAKLIHYGSFLPYAYCVLILCALGSYVLTLAKLPQKSLVGSVIYRKAKESRAKISNVTAAAVALVLISCGIMAYYDFYASKPPKLSNAEVLEPIDGEFKIPLKLLDDNDLHRFAYITDAGNKIRFFALNRFVDRASPVVVFDACMICGDMGYIKSGDELICISCNVRIFLPSVGKEGGCNPIPLKYEIDDEWITVSLSDVEKGVNYFNEIVEKEVKDPVSGATIINQKAPHSYIYGGKTYFFENQENYKKFMEDPKRYAETIIEAHWRAQGFVSLKD